MKVDKMALRLVPVTLLFEMLAPVITLLFIVISAVITNHSGTQTGSIAVILSSLVLLAIWMAGMVVIYGIMDLSRYFRYSWYLHIVFLS